MVEPQSAATVMIARELGGGLEYFLLRRSSRSAFMPDVFVFPGGRVDAADARPEALARLHAAPPTLDPACVFAAARETFEECGLLFACEPTDAGLLATARADILAGRTTFTRMLRDLRIVIDGGALRYFSRWVTPAGESRRFDTHFFVARAPDGQHACADALETHDGIWITPRDALARAAAGAFALIFPTIKHLERVRDFTSIDALLAFAGRKSIHTVMPERAAGAVVIPAALENVW